MRGERRNIRRNISLNSSMDHDLKRLAVACNMSTSTLIYTILEKVMYDEEWFSVRLQDEYGVSETLRAFLMKENGKKRYL